MKLFAIASLAILCGCDTKEEEPPPDPAAESPGHLRTPEAVVEEAPATVPEAPQQQQKPEPSPETDPVEEEKPAPTAEEAPERSLVTIHDKSAAPEFPPQIDEMIHQRLTIFFGLLGKNNIDAAYDSLVKGTVIAQKQSTVDTLKGKTREAIELFGRIRDFRIVEVERVGDILVRTTALSLGERFPLRWRFYFYSIDGKWRLIDMRVDDRLMDLFSERDTAGGTLRP